MVQEMLMSSGPLFLLPHCFPLILCLPCQPHLRCRPLWPLWPLSPPLHCHQYSTCDPPHKQLLIGLDMGGVLSFCHCGGPGAVPHCGEALVLIPCCHLCLPSSTCHTQLASRGLQQWVVVSIVIVLPAHVDTLTSHLNREGYWVAMGLCCTFFVVTGHHQYSTT